MRGGSFTQKTLKVTLSKNEFFFKFDMTVAQMLPLFKETVIKDRVDISLRSVTYFF